VTTAGADQTGPRLMFQSHCGWVLIPSAGKLLHAVSSDPGIYTKGQLQCIAVIVAKFSGGAWSEAHLAHVSYAKHSLVTTLLQDYTDGESYVAIGAKPGSLGWMNEIRQRFAAKARNVWVYVAGDNSPDFGMNREGYFGETVQWVRATPRG
jgi:hypothetical protein